MLAVDGQRLADAVVPIVYGFPSRPLMEAARAGKIVMGQPFLRFLLLVSSVLVGHFVLC